MCKSCNYATTKKGLWARHLKTAKHARNAKGGPDTYNKKKYVCGCGNKYSSNSSLWRHGQKCSKYTKKKKVYRCECGKEFKFRQGLWHHRQKQVCVPEDEDILEERKKRIQTEMEMTQLKTLIQKITNHINKYSAADESTQVNNSKLTNCLNNNITINVFLNERCPNAIPIMDFIKNLEFTLTDINPEKPISSVESLKNVLIEALKQTPVPTRPVHCSDAKRLNFYVKDSKDGWIKDKDNEKIKKAIDWANMRHQAAWYTSERENLLNKKINDTNWHKMNIAMASFSDNPEKARSKCMRGIASATNIKRCAEFNKFKKENNIKLPIIVEEEENIKIPRNTPRSGAL